MPELNTTMITGAVITLMSDPHLFALRNSKRTRRILFFASIVAGSFIGAALLRFRSPSAVLLICTCIKFLITASFLFNRGMVQHRLDVEGGVAAISGAVTPVPGAATPVKEILWGDWLAKDGNSMQQRLGDIVNGADGHHKKAIVRGAL